MQPVEISTGHALPSASPNWRLLCLCGSIPHLTQHHLLHNPLICVPLLPPLSLFRRFPHVCIIACFYPLGATVLVAQCLPLPLPCCIHSRHSRHHPTAPPAIAAAIAATIIVFIRRLPFPPSHVVDCCLFPSSWCCHSHGMASASKTTTMPLSTSLAMRCNGIGVISIGGFDLEEEKEEEEKEEQP